MPFHSTLSIARRTLRLDHDGLQFLRSWIEKPLATGAVMPSGRPLARAMAHCVDRSIDGPVIELGPGTGAVTSALVEQGIAPSRLVLVEFNPVFCRLMRSRYPEATVIRGDAYALKRLLAGRLSSPAAAIVSGLPLFTKPLEARLGLVSDAFTLLAPQAPFIQFTYAMVSPVPRSHADARACERVWLNIPPARVWVYRGPPPAPAGR